MKEVRDQLSNEQRVTKRPASSSRSWMTDTRMGGLPTTTTAPHLPARGADNDAQAASRELKDSLLRQWTTAEMIKPIKTWGKHKPESKIAMTLEGCEVLGWSVTTFDTRMEEYVTRIKAKRKRTALKCVTRELVLEDSNDH